MTTLVLSNAATGLVMSVIPWASLAILVLIGAGALLRFLPLLTTAEQDDQVSENWVTPTDPDTVGELLGVDIALFADDPSSWRRT